MASLLQLGHFGGWLNKGIVDESAAAVTWGNPMYRNLEITPTDDGVTTNPVILQLPKISRATIGAEYNIFVFNDASETNGSLQIQDYDGVDIVRPDAADLLIVPSVPGDGDFVTLINDGTNWIITNPYLTGATDHAASYQVPASGGSWPESSITVDLYQNTSHVNAKKIAVSNGYAGQDNFRVVIRCHDMLLGATYLNVPAFNTGSGWGSGCSVHLELINSIVSGYGGVGGGRSGTVELAPGNGGDAIHAYTELVVIADGTSVVTAGGGGGPSDNLTEGGGGGNGGNMTEGGAITGASGGNYFVGGAVQPYVSGDPGSTLEGGLGRGSARDGGSWGAGIAGNNYTSTGGKVAANSGGAAISWSASASFRWGNAGTPTNPSSGFPTTVSI
jgi:hypothetical protein